MDGRNSLDFVLTMVLGRMIAADPGGYFHIVSKDTNFDSVVRHLKGETKLPAGYGVFTRRNTFQKFSKIRFIPKPCRSDWESFWSSGEVRRCTGRLGEI